jgi:hypothetical protein
MSYGDFDTDIRVIQTFLFIPPVLPDNERKRSLQLESAQLQQHQHRLACAENQVKKWFSNSSTVGGSHALSIEQTLNMLKHSKAKPFENWFDLGCGEPRVALRISAYLQCQVLASEISDDIFTGIKDCLGKTVKTAKTIKNEIELLSKPMLLEVQLEAGVRLSIGEGVDYFKNVGRRKQILRGDAQETEDEAEDDSAADYEDDESSPVLFDSSPEVMKKNADEDEDADDDDEFVGIVEWSSNKKPKLSSAVGNATERCSRRRGNNKPAAKARSPKGKNEKAAAGIRRSDRGKK